MKDSGPHIGPIGSITDEEWEKAWRKLRVHVRRKYFWFCLRTGYSMDGLAVEALLDVWSGDRRYPPIDKNTGLERTDVTLFAFLCQTVRSHVSHLGQRKPLSNLDDLENFLPSHDVEELRPLFQFKQNSVEDDLSYKLLVNSMLELVEDDALLGAMVRLWSEDPELRPREMADALGVEIEDLRAAQKRLRRRLTRFGGESHD